jgi:hypothetical protein
MAKKRDLDTYDPKSAKNPLNKGEMQPPVTDQELGYLEYGGDTAHNPKNQPEQERSFPERKKSDQRGALT